MMLLGSLILMPRVEQMVANHISQMVGPAPGWQAVKKSSR